MKNVTAEKKFILDEVSPFFKTVEHDVADGIRNQQIECTFEPTPDVTAKEILSRKGEIVLDLLAKHEQAVEKTKKNHEKQNIEPIGHVLPSSAQWPMPDIVNKSPMTLGENEEDHEIRDSRMMNSSFSLNGDDPKRSFGDFDNKRHIKNNSQLNNIEKRQASI